MQIHNAAVTGSFTYNGIDISDITGSEQSVVSLNEFSASILNYTSSNNQSVTTLQGATASLQNATSSLHNATSSLQNATASLYAATASLSGATSSLFTYTASNSANVANLFATSASLNAAVTQIYNATASLYAATASIYNATASIYGATSSLFNYSASSNLRIGSLEQYTASLNTRSASFACVNATNNFACTQYFSNTSNAVSFTSTGSLYSDGGVRITRDMYVSGTAFFNNVTVFGTQSINYISSSQLNIASNIISVNTATPTVRFGGLAVYDSGSLGTGLTGSILWDSEDNQWIYSNPSGSTYDSALFLVGPRNTGVLGNEPGISCNFLSKGNGMHHMTSSGIFEDGSRTCFYGSGFITNTGVSCFTTSCAASIIGGSISGTTISGTTGTFSSNVVVTGSLIVAPSSNVELQVQSTGVTIGNLVSDNHNVTGSLRITGSLNTVGTVCATGNTCFGGMSIVTNCLGIGTTTPSSRVEVLNPAGDTRITVTSTTSTGASDIMLKNSGGTVAYEWLVQGLGSDGRFRIFDNCGASTGERFTIDQSGNVGINCVAPGFTLDVNGTFNVRTSTGSEVRIINYGGSSAKIRGTQSTLAIEACGAFTVESGGATERLRINENGIACFACQICSTTISATTEFRLGASFARVATLDAGGGFGGGYNFNWNNGSPIHDSTGALSGYGYANDGSIRLYTNSSSAANTAAPERFRINASGIATFACQICAPVAVIGGQISVNAGNGNQLYLNNTGQRYTQITFDNNSSGATKGGLWWDNTTCFFEMYSSFTGGLRFYTSGDLTNSRLTITSGGIACFACQVCVPSLYSAFLFGCTTTTLNQSLSNTTLTLEQRFGDMTGGGDYQGGSILLSSNSSGGSSWAGGAITALVGNPGATSNFPGGLGFWTKTANGATGTSGLIQAMRIDYNGKIGISTTTPTRQLTVASDTSIYNGASSDGAIDPGQHEVLTAGFNVVGQSSLDISTINVTLNKWKAVVRGGFANNNEGGGLTSPALEIEVDSNNPSIPVGGSSITFSRNSSTGKLQVTNNNTSNLRTTFVGTIHVINYPQSVLPSRSKIMLGSVGIGTVNPNSRLEVQKTGAVAAAIFINQCSADEATIRFKSTHDANSDYRVGASILYNSAFEIYSVNCAIDRFWISQCGAVMIGTGGDSAVNSADPVHKIGSVGGGTSYARLMMQERTGNWISFNNGSGTNYGTISLSGSNVVYGGQSDYRLKTNIQNMQSVISKIMCLRPVSFNWKKGCDYGEGFIAHELQEIIPLAVTGQKDAISEETGCPVYQNVDTRHIVPSLVKAIQEQQCTINTLKTCLGIA